MLAFAKTGSKKNLSDTFLTGFLVLNLLKFCLKKSIVQTLTSLNQILLFGFGNRNSFI